MSDKLLSSKIDSLGSVRASDAYKGLSAAEQRRFDELVAQNYSPGIDGWDGKVGLTTQDLRRFIAARSAAGGLQLREPRASQVQQPGVGLDWTSLAGALSSSPMFPKPLRFMFCIAVMCLLTLGGRSQAQQPAAPMSALGGPPDSLMPGGPMGTSIRRGRAITIIDIEAIRLHADFNHLCAQLMKHMGRNMVGRSMSAIDHNFQRR